MEVSFVKEQPGMNAQPTSETILALMDEIQKVLTFELSGRCPTEIQMTTETTPAALRLSEGLGGWKLNTWKDANK